MRTLATKENAALVRDEDGELFVRIAVKGREILVDAGGYTDLLDATMGDPFDDEEVQDTARWVIEGVFEALRAGLPGTVSEPEDDDLTFYRSRPRTAREIAEARNSPEWRDLINAGLSEDDIAALVAES